MSSVSVAKQYQRFKGARHGSIDGRAPQQGPLDERFTHAGETTAVGALLNPKVNFGGLFQTFTEANTYRKDYDQQSAYSGARRERPLLGAKAGRGGTESLKACLRIWSGFSKFIRSQCSKGRIIDSQHLGTFYRDGPSEAGALSSDPAAAPRYVFALGGKSNALLSEFKLKPNAENVPEVPEELVLKRDFVSCNVISIAQVCNC